MTYISKSIEVEIDMDEFDDDELLEECISRGLGVYGRHAILLAEYIVEGRTDEALELLAELSGGAFNPGTIKRLAADRGAAA